MPSSTNVVASVKPTSSGIAAASSDLSTSTNSRNGNIRTRKNFILWLLLAFVSIAVLYPRNPTAANGYPRSMMYLHPRFQKWYGRNSAAASTRNPIKDREFRYWQMGRSYEAIQKEIKRMHDRESEKVFQTTRTPIVISTRGYGKQEKPVGNSDDGSQVIDIRHGHGKSWPLEVIFNCHICKNRRKFIIFSDGLAKEEDLSNKPQRRRYYKDPDSVFTVPIFT